ncbi:MAG: 2,3-bisphosphoglycerate-independent phosphoglycerate mutase [Planctomycetota bacterium]|nr:2,3-bisphosphoglycerate-independent phosphoglycerate mutase [Planctomycetota bacterium]
MKYVIIIPDGAADLPVPELAGQTPLEAARMPHAARLATMGQLGTVRTTPPGFAAGSDICCMTLLGYSADRYHTGRAPLEAGALGLMPGLQDWIFRLNLVTTSDVGPAAPSDESGLMIYHSAGAITDAEAGALVRALAAHWARVEPQLAAQFSLHPGVSYRNILIDRSLRDYRGGLGGKDRLQTFPPHEIPRKPWRKFLPRGSHSDLLIRLMESSRACLAPHEVNVARREAGLREATMAWIWGQGTRPNMPSYASRFGVRGCITTAVDLLAGIAAFTGLERIAVPGLTSYHDNDYAAQGRASIAALDRYDLVIVHVEAPDEASHQGDFQTKVAALEAIDAHIVGPLLEELERRYTPRPGAPNVGWRMLIAPDHYTLCSTLKHDATPPPFVIAGSGIRALGRGPFCESAAAGADLHVEPGEALMEHFYFGGRRKAEPAGAGAGA